MRLKVSECSRASNTVLLGSLAAAALACVSGPALAGCGGLSTSTYQHTGVHSGASTGVHSGSNAPSGSIGTSLPSCPSAASAAITGPGAVARGSLEGVHTGTRNAAWTHHNSVRQMHASTAANKSWKRKP